MPECPTSQEVDDHPTTSSITLESRKKKEKKRNDSKVNELNVN